MNTTSLKKPRRPPFTSYSELTEALDAATARAEKAETELDRLRAEVEALKQSIESGQRVLREDAERNAARAERAEAALAIERQTLSGVIKLKMHFEAESLEQARLLGMSASREASLLGKISRLEHQLEK
jgi:hypothetical protein